MCHQRQMVLYTTHRSMPANPLLAETMYLYGTIERMGTGTKEMIIPDKPNSRLQKYRLTKKEKN